jgi:hypothetical protein
MNTAEKHWQENMEDYIRKAYASMRAEKSQELGSIVRNWERLTGSAERTNLWRAMNIFSLNDLVDVESEGARKLISLDRVDSVEELDIPEIDMEYEIDSSLNAKHPEAVGWRNGYPVLPVFLFADHAERNGYELEFFENLGTEGVSASRTSTEGDKFSRVNLTNSSREQEDRITYHQWFGNPVIGDETFDTQEVYTGRNRQNYVEEVWEKEFLTLLQRGERVHEAAEEAVEEIVPELVDLYNSNDRYSDVEGGFEALKKNLRLFAGEDFSEDAGNYLEASVASYHEDPNGSSIIDRFEQEFGLVAGDEGDAHYLEESGESATAEKKRQRKQALLSQYLDLVWQSASERYGG